MASSALEALNASGMAALRRAKAKLGETVPDHPTDPDRDVRGHFREGNQAAKGNPSEIMRRNGKKGAVESSAARREGKIRRGELLEAVIQENVSARDIAQIVRQMVKDAKEPDAIKARAQLFDRLFGKVTYEPDQPQKGPDKLLVLMERIVEIERQETAQLEEETIEGEWTIDAPTSEDKETDL